MTSDERGALPHKGEHRGAYIPWLFVGLFAIVVMVNGVMIMFALSSFPGLVTQTAFEEGVAYNEALSGLRAQTERGWQVETRLQPTGLQPTGLQPTGLSERIVEVMLRDRESVPLTGAAVTLRFVRPTVGGRDVAVVLREGRPGRYTGTLTLPLPGIWDVHVAVDHDRGDYQAVERITVVE